MEITRYTVPIVTIMSLKVHILFENIDFEMSIQRPYCPYRVHIFNVEPFLSLSPLLELFGTFYFFLILFFLQILAPFAFFSKKN